MLPIHLLESSRRDTVVAGGVGLSDNGEILTRRWGGRERGLGFGEYHLNISHGRFEPTSKPTHASYTRRSGPF